MPKRDQCHRHYHDCDSCRGTGRVDVDSGNLSLGWIACEDCDAYEYLVDRTRLMGEMQAVLSEMSHDD